MYIIQSGSENESFVIQTLPKSIKQPNMTDCGSVIFIDFIEDQPTLDVVQLLTIQRVVIIGLS
jgi:hypothetical protein